jgi:hypothetical protein
MPGDSNVIQLHCFVRRMLARVSLLCFGCGRDGAVHLAHELNQALSPIRADNRLSVGRALLLRKKVSH